MLKPVLQSEAAECGLASLAMVAAHYGGNSVLPELRRRFPTSLKGANLHFLTKVAQQLGFTTRSLRLELEELGHLKCPCILHWNLNHFVVLERVRSGKATIVDPALGRRNLSLEEVSRCFTGIALELRPTPEFQQSVEAPSVSIRDLTGQIRGGFRSVTQVLLLSLALQAFVLIGPLYLQLVVDHALVSADSNLLTVLGIGFGLALLLHVLTGFLRSWSVVNLSSQMGIQWTSNVFAHLLRLPMEYFHKRQVGDLTSRMASVHAIRQTLANSFFEAVVDGAMALVTLALMLVYSWKLAAVTVVAVALYMAIRTLAYSWLRDAAERQLVATAKQQTHLLESIRGMQSIKVSCIESVRQSTYENVMIDAINQDIQVGRMTFTFGSVSQLVFGIERIAVIWIGAALALQNVFSAGMLIAYLAYKEQFSQRMSGLIDKWMEFRMLRLHCERLADIVLTPPEPTQGASEIELNDGIEIRVENLSFRYAEGEPWVIKDCSFTVRSGESIAITGASGCGKTTLLKVMLGLLTPTQGSIYFGGHSLRDLGARNARAAIGAVMQDDQLFAGSIADNISFFDDRCDMLRVELAAKHAAVHDDIMAMPMAYNSLIGDMGSALSGGQKQRVILARALYRNPKVLFLDEATSHLDAANERAVNSEVSRLRLTKVIIAHRQETIDSCERVLIMRDGHIIEERCTLLTPLSTSAEESCLSL